MGFIWRAIKLSFNIILIVCAAAIRAEDDEEILSIDSKITLYERLRLLALRNLQDIESESGAGFVPFGKLAYERSGLSDAFYLRPSIERSACAAWDSCILRCGDPTLGAPYLCSCDPECTFYKDCCVDYKFYCGEPQTNQSQSVQALEEEESSESFQEFLLDYNDDPIEDGVSKVIVDDPDENVTLVCKPMSEVKFYGQLYLNGKQIGRKCVLEEPPWCDPEFMALNWGWTQSLSILMNFGPPGWNNDLLFSSDYYNPDQCPSVWEIWDPFAHVCRPIECNKDYIIEDGKCVWDGESPEPPDTKEFLGYKSKEANITFYGNILLPDNWAQFALNIMRGDIKESLAQKIRIGSDRIRDTYVDKDNFRNSSTTRPTTTSTTTSCQTDVTDSTNGTGPLPGADDIHLWVLTEEGFPTTIHFTLTQREDNDTDLSIEQVLSVLNEAVALRAVLRTTKGVPMKINAIEKSIDKEEISFFEEWCRGGDLLKYWNEEFQPVFVLTNRTGVVRMEMAARITATGFMYDEGDYVANLLYQSSDMNAKASNVSGILIVCENRPRIEDLECVRMPLNETEYDIMENGTLEYLGHVRGVSKYYDRTEYEFKDNGNVVVCINYDEAVQNYRVLPEPSLIEKIASLITTCLIGLSLIGLFLTVLTYCIFPELRNLPGCCLMHFCATMFTFFLLFIVGARRPMTEKDIGCTLIAILLHLSSLAFFTWSSIISYDLFATFTTFQAVSRARSKYLWRYTLIGYGVPLSIVFITVMLEFHTSISVDYGQNVCWIGNPEIAMYIFAIPILASILLNVAFFVLTVRGILRVGKSSQLSKLREKDRSRFSIYIRISSVQCFAWFLGFLSVFFNFSNIIAIIFEFAFIILSSLQGLYIFVAFALNPRVIELYKGLAQGGPRTKGFGYDPSSFSGRTAVRPNKVYKTNSNSSYRADFDRNRNAAARTVSNQTTISYISNTDASCC